MAGPAGNRRRRRKSGSTPFTDASYHLPAFYELWARWGPEQDRAFWARVATVSRDFFVKAAHPKTGLVPNLSQFDGTPLGWGRWPAAFREDAWRVAMDWSVDWSWWAKDPRQRELSYLMGLLHASGRFQIFRPRR